MITYQEYEEKVLSGKMKVEDFIDDAINHHLSSEEYQIAVDADEYDAQRNSTIISFVQKIYSATGRESIDPFASNNKLCSNFFRRLNTQRCSYLLGNGVSFVDHKREITNSETGTKMIIDETKEKLGSRFDSDLKKIAYNALIHSVSFGFWDLNRLRNFKLTEFVPLWDEYTGALRAGIRFWRLKPNKPMIAVFYEVDGFAKYRKETSKAGKSTSFELIEPKKGYIQTITKTQNGGIEDIAYSHYDGFPIVPLWGSELRQSTLVGMKSKIDAYDLINSGFANDIQDCAEIYWIVSGGRGMDAKDLSRFRQKLKLNKIVDAEEKDSNVTPYTQDIPYNARETFLARIENQIYKDFGAFNPEKVSAGNVTATQIEASYQPLDEETDDFEYMVTDFVQSILELMGIEDTPVFKRNKISNQPEQTQMILSAAEYLDTETILRKLPFITTDEVSEILARKDKEMEERMEQMAQMQNPSPEPEEGDEEDDEDLTDEE